MFVTRMIRYARRRKGLAAQRALEHIETAERFRREMDRERARSDRSGETFSLVIYGSRAKPLAKEAFGRLAAVLLRRLRITDTVGWIDAERVGLLLPCTPAAGARLVVDDVRRQLGEGGHPFHVAVYTYPWRETREEPPRNAEGHQAPDGEPPVLPMEPLFLQAMPAWKRGLDLLGASLALLLLAPLLLFLAALVKLTSPGPVLFGQRRAGLGGKPFTLYKFRTMVADAERRRAALAHLNEQDGPAFKIKDDPRITWLGRWLRKLSLDELPQLWNVLRGDMSLVGPRPLPCEEAAACAPWQRRRLDVTPGLTCIWQVRGRGKTSFADWIRMDMAYIRGRSWKTDLLLILDTIPAVLSGRGAC